MVPNECTVASGTHGPKTERCAKCCCRCLAIEMVTCGQFKSGADGIETDCQKMQPGCGALELCTFRVKQPGRSDSIAEKALVNPYASESDRMGKIKQIIVMFTKDIGQAGKGVPVWRVVEEAVKVGLKHDVVERDLDRLQMQGDAYAPRHGLIALVG